MTTQAPTTELDDLPPRAPRQLASLREALSLMRDADYAATKRVLWRLLSDNPDDAMALSLYGVCLAREGLDFDKALQCCTRALAVAPRSVELQVNLGRVQRLMGNRRAAYSTFLRAWRLDEQHVEPATELARMGVRRKPVVPFLSRSHSLNRVLGRLRQRLRHLSLFLYLRRDY